jgi:8-oxo-dGTP pyrophosphatase MutT (NUDIX family)
MPGKQDATAAAIEADEEAGVKGKIAASPVGSFAYVKNVGSRAVPVIAAVFPLHVKRAKSRWKERKDRKRKWLSADEAAANWTTAVCGNSSDNMRTRFVRSRSNSRRRRHETNYGDLQVVPGTKPHPAH